MSKHLFILSGFCPCIQNISLVFVIRPEQQDSLFLCNRNEIYGCQFTPCPLYASYKEQYQIFHNNKQNFPRE